jgi:hypothetical protein
MKRRSCLVAVLLFALTTLVSGQNLRLPRDPDKLIDRAQKFWADVISRQRSKAVDFVLPAKKDVFLSGTSLPIIKAKVVGLDLTMAADQAVVRVALDVLSPGDASGFVNWTSTDTWVWREGNWYLNVADNLGIYAGGTGTPPANGKEVQEDLAKNFQILRNEFDLGKLIQGEYPPPLEVPIKYTGNLKLSVEQELPNPIVNLASMSDTVESNTNTIQLLVSTENWVGPFSLPFPLKMRFGDVFTERTVLIKGNVFVPLVFRQSPPDGPVPGQQFSIFIQNNTDEQAMIGSVIVDGKMDLMNEPEALLPHDEVELVFKLHSDEIPDRLSLVLKTPIQGRSNYIYPIRTARR